MCPFMPYTSPETLPGLDTFNTEWRRNRGAQRKNLYVLLCLILLLRLSQDRILSTQSGGETEGHREKTYMSFMPYMVQKKLMFSF